jgi:hypothetical protein
MPLGIFEPGFNAKQHFTEPAWNAHGSMWSTTYKRFKKLSLTEPERKGLVEFSQSL